MTMPLMKACLIPALLFLLSQCAYQEPGTSAPPYSQQQAPAYPQSSSYVPPYPQPGTSDPQGQASWGQPAPSPEYQAPAAGYSQNGAWQLTSSVRRQALPGGAELHEFTARSAAESAEVCVVVFDSRSYALRVLDQPMPNAGSQVLTPLMRGAGAIAGVNGGFFHPDFSPLGLMIADGRKAGQFTQTSLISGSMVLISQEPYLVWNPEFLGDNGVAQMLQAGPRLVDAGQPLASLNRTKNANRSFIATDGQRMWAIGTVRSTTLAGLGDLLASPGILPNIRVQRALNLDGGRSTAFYARKNDGQEISRPGWSTVRNYLAVVPR